MYYRLHAGWQAVGYNRIFFGETHRSGVIVAVIKNHSVITLFFYTTTYTAIPYFGT